MAWSWGAQVQHVPFPSLPSLPLLRLVHVPGGRRQEHLTCPALVLFPAESVGFGPCNISLGAKLSGLGAGWHRFGSGTNINITRGVDLQRAGDSRPRRAQPGGSRRTGTEEVRLSSETSCGSGGSGTTENLAPGAVWSLLAGCRGAPGLRTAHLLLWLITNP